MMANKILLTALMLLISSFSFALEKKSICTWDPVGKNGPVMTFYSDLKPKAIAWGLDLEFIAYTDEKVAANDFKAGVCDGAHLTATLSRQFVPFAGTLDAVGGITTQEGLEQIIALLSKNAKLADQMKNGNYEAVAAWPVGSMFAFVNDKSINTVADFSGKKISVLNEDPQILKLANLVGASPVGTSLATFSGQFNNGNIDILFMPALAYNTFELYHGLGEKGAILDYKLFYGMLQTIIKTDSWANINFEGQDFGQLMRSYVVGRLKDINKLVSDAEKEIPAKYWLKTSDKTKDELSALSKQIRVELKAEGKMDPIALKVLQKIRCSGSSAAECSVPE